MPTDPVSIAVALADKIDTLVGFWAIDEKPTGSKDPYALRRAALGVLRIALENGVRLPLWKLFRDFGIALRNHWIDQSIGEMTSILTALPREITRGREFDSLVRSLPKPEDVVGRWNKAFWDSTIDADDLLAFFAERLKVHLRESGARHDLADAVLSLGNQDDFVSIVRRVEALGRFLDTDDGKNLLAGTKRAGNILAIEEKKDKRRFDGAPDARLYSLDEEKALAQAIDQAKAEAGSAVANEDFSGAMSAMARLRPAVDAFFDKVKVNDDDAKVRENRLKLLNEIRAATRAVADFSRIEG